MCFFLFFSVLAFGSDVFFLFFVSVACHKDKFVASIPKFWKVERSSIWDPLSSPPVVPFCLFFSSEDMPLEDVCLDVDFQETRCLIFQE